MELSAEEQSSLAHVRKALVENRFGLKFEPIVDIRTGRPRYHEVLVRLHDENGNEIPPAAFIPLSEKAGIMNEIDRAVVTRLPGLLHARPHWEITVNLSGQSLTDEKIAAGILKEFELTGSDPHRVVFEITETQLIENLARARALIGSLREAGFRFALDDFGAGFTSFSYLRELPVDFLKIDGSFIKNLPEDPFSLAVVRAVNNLAHVLKLETIAEFVDRPEILEKLKDIGIDYAQGFLFGEPSADGG